MSEKQPMEIQYKRIEYDNIIYYINEVENEAIVIGSNENQEKITIPQSINIGSKEYEITSINDNAFKNSKIQIIEIPNDSKLKTIGKHAFSFSKIKRIKIPSSVTSIGEHAFSYCEQLEKIIIPSNSKLQTIEKDVFCFARIKSITIPSELTDLKEGWCCGAFCLKKITVSLANPRYLCYENKLIIGKTNIKQDNYDCLVFCVRNIEYIQIPNFIEHICSYSFNRCEQLEEILISSDSKLKIINEHAFCSSTIKRIIIPPSVISIGEYAFSVCKQLEEILIPSDSKLRMIEKDAFSYSAIKSITIPSELIELKKGWCICTFELTKITVSPTNPRYCFVDEKIIIGKTNIQQDNYDCLVFCIRNIEHIQIPNFIKHICSYSFDRCEQLEEILISSDSKLETIDEHAFCSSTIKRIIIPSSVISIGEYAFSDCKQLEEINIPSDSKLRTIEKDAFSYSTIKSITIPSELTDLKEGWCSYTPNLTKITVSPTNPRYLCYENKLIIGKTNIKQDNYDCLVFCVRNIEHIQIPNFIEHICSYSFNRCEQLEEILISSDSRLETINEHAFCSSTIKRIIIPSSVISIGERAFCFCRQLEAILIPSDSKLQTINEHAFCSSAIKSIKIPSSVTSIGEHAFSDCKQLEEIIIPSDSKLQTIGKYAFFSSKITSIIIPSSVTFIGEYTFGFCKMLHIIEIINREMISIYQESFKSCTNAYLMIPVE